jgi:DNA-binding NtrC family response regulator
MIHRFSRRASQPFVPVDCSSIAPSLLESELFGAMRGAFTGANRDLQRKTLYRKLERMKL